MARRKWWQSNKSSRRPAYAAHRGPRRPSIFKSALIGLASAGVALFFAAERFPEHVGPLVALTSVNKFKGPVTHVRDGDTIEIAGVPIRFGSLDCPESRAPVGQKATRKIKSLLSGEALVRHLNGRTSYDRKIGSCTLQDGRDLAAVMIREGYCSRFW